MKEPFKYAEQRGHIYFWKYCENLKNYPGWNLSADDAGCVSTIEILDELLKGYVRYRSLKVSHPTDNVLKVPNNREGRARWYSPQRIRIERVAQGVTKPSFNLDEKDSTVTLRLDTPTLEMLGSAFRDIMDGKGDFVVEIAGQDVWPWWHL